MLVQLVILGTPLTDKLFEGLTVSEPPQSADVIVCLGGDLRRITNTADLFHRKFAPTVVVTNLPGAAESMRDMLVRFGVPADQVLVDATSYVTADHPAGVAKLPGIDPATQRFLIVTDHEHGRRAAACFRHAGYKHIRVYGGPLPAQTGSSLKSVYRWRIRELPRIICEYAALVEYRLRGRI